jgi:xanthine dehydrogenase YagR molybdenum-binding subunit
MPDAIPFTPPHLRFGSSSGQPINRRDGHLKVTGAATYAADNNPGNLLHGVVATSTIARGRVVSLDVDAAKAHPGVVEVITPANRPPLALDPDEKHGLFGFRFEALQNDRVRYAKQPIAFVVAETLEAATEGARLLAPQYEVEPARIGFAGGERYENQTSGVGGAPAFDVGDLDAGFAAATRRIDAEFETPAQFHNAMEPHALVAEWDGDRLTIDTPNQAIVMARGAFADFFGISGGKRAVAQPVHRWRFRLEGDPRRAADTCCPGGANGRAAGQAGTDTRPDVRTCRPSRRRRSSI